MRAPTAVDEAAFQAQITFGHCEIRSWFEFDGEKLVGMGNCKTFDVDGKLTDYTESPTGVTMSLPGWGDPAPRSWWHTVFDRLI